MAPLYPHQQTHYLEIKIFLTFWLCKTLNSGHIQGQLQGAQKRNKYDILQCEVFCMYHLSYLLYLLQVTLQYTLQ